MVNQIRGVGVGVGVGNLPKVEAAADPFIVASTYYSPMVTHLPEPRVVKMGEEVKVINGVSYPLQIFVDQWQQMFQEKVSALDNLEQEECASLKVSDTGITCEKERQGRCLKEREKTHYPHSGGINGYTIPDDPPGSDCAQWEHISYTEFHADYTALQNISRGGTLFTSDNVYFTGSDGEEHSINYKGDETAAKAAQLLSDLSYLGNAIRGDARSFPEKTNADAMRRQYDQDQKFAEQLQEFDAKFGPLTLEQKKLFLENARKKAEDDGWGY